MKEKGAHLSNNYAVKLAGLHLSVIFISVPIFVGRTQGVGKPSNFPGLQVQG